tara:strand:+ start:40421 stop:41791 length:1371 start_codon:yes stop_codon:yes gene_type:complete
MSSCSHFLSIKEALPNTLSPFEKNLAELCLFSYIHYTPLGHNNLNKDKISNINTINIHAIKKTITTKSNDQKILFGENTHYHGLFYKSSPAKNYNSVENIVRKISTLTGKNIFFLERKDFFLFLSSISDSKEIKSILTQWIKNNLLVNIKPYDKVKDPDNSLSIVSEILWQYICSYVFLKKHLNHYSLNSFIITNPYNPVEKSLIALAQSNGIKLLFIPHGLPQASFRENIYDYIFPLTIMDNAWRKFSNAKKIYIPWHESIYYDLPFPSPKKHFNILIFSQLEGAELHLMPELENELIRLVNTLLLIKKYKNHSPNLNINIRFRNARERELFKKKCHVMSCDHDESLFFSCADEQSVINDLSDANCVIGFSSTALLYSQLANIPAIQLTNKNIYNVWPYQLTSKDLIIFTDSETYTQNIEESLLNCISSNYSRKPLFFREFNPSNIELSKGALSD